MCENYRSNTPKGYRYLLADSWIILKTLSHTSLCHLNCWTCHWCVFFIFISGQLERFHAKLFTFYQRGIAFKIKDDVFIRSTAQYRNPFVQHHIHIFIMYNAWFSLYFIKDIIARILYVQFLGHKKKRRE